MQTQGMAEFACSEILYVLWLDALAHSKDKCRAIPLAGNLLKRFKKLLKTQSIAHI